MIGIPGIPDIPDETPVAVLAVFDPRSAGREVLVICAKCRLSKTVPETIDYPFILFICLTNQNQTLWAKFWPVL